jgi:hypothetical protein
LPVRSRPARRRSFCLQESDRPESCTPCNCGSVQSASVDNLQLVSWNHWHANAFTSDCTICSQPPPSRLRRKVVRLSMRNFSAGRLGTEAHVFQKVVTARPTDVPPQLCDGSFAFNSRVPASVASSHRDDRDRLLRAIETSRGGDQILVCVNFGLREPRTRPTTRRCDPSSR